MRSSILFVVRLGTWDRIVDIGVVELINEKLGTNVLGFDLLMLDEMVYYPQMCPNFNCSFIYPIKQFFFPLRGPSNSLKRH